MKNKGKIARINVVGIVLVILFCFIIVSFTLLLHFNSENELSKLLRNRAIVSDNTSIGIQNTLNGIINSEVTEDQVISSIPNGVPVIEIPSLSITVPISEGTDDYSLKYSAGHFTETSDYGQLGNCAIAGHSSSMYTCVFNNLDKIKVLDEINIYNQNGDKFTYTVTGVTNIIPEYTFVLSDFGDTRLTVITCSNQGTMRLCVTAKLLSQYQVTAFKKEMSEGKVTSMKELTSRVSDIHIIDFLNSRKQLKPVLHSLPITSFEKNRINDYVWFHKN